MDARETDGGARTSWVLLVSSNCRRTRSLHGCGSGTVRKYRSLLATWLKLRVLVWNSVTSTQSRILSKYIQ